MQPQPLQDALDRCVGLVGIDAPDKKALLEILAERAQGEFEWVDAASLFEAIWAREQEASTGIGGGVAIPHAVIDGLEHPFCLVARLDRPVPYDAVDGQPVEVVFMLASPEGEGQAGVATKHVRMLARLARLCMRPGFISGLLSASTGDEIVALIQEENARHV